MDYKKLFLFLLIMVGCGKPGPFFQPFTCDMGFKQVHYTIRDTTSDYEVLAVDEAHGFQDVVYRGHGFFCVDLVDHILPVTCRTLGGAVILDEETIDLDEV